MELLPLLVSSVIMFVLFHHGCSAKPITDQCVCSNTTIVCSNATENPFVTTKYCSGKITVVVLHNKRVDSLQDDDLAGFNDLNYLVLFRNELKAVTEGVFNKTPNLKYLFINRNPIQNLPSGLFSGLPRIRKISLTGNHLDNLPARLFSGLRALRSLKLNDNKLTALAPPLFLDLENLEVLDLSDNQLKSIPYGIFKNLISLNYLHLTSNQLTSIKGNVLNGMVSLNEFRVNKNHLSVLPPYDASWPAKIETAFYFFDNNITSINENVLQSWLNAGDLHRLLILSTRNSVPLRSISSLSSMLRDPSLEPFVDGPCLCGGIKKGKAEVRFCIAVACGGPNKPKNWIEAFRK